MLFDQTTSRQGQRKNLRKRAAKYRIKLCASEPQQHNVWYFHTSVLDSQGVECDCVWLPPWAEDDNRFKATLCLRENLESYAHEHLIFNAIPYSKAIKGDDTGIVE